MIYFVIIPNVRHMDECNSPRPPAILYQKIKIFENKLKQYVDKKLIKYGKGRVLVTIPRKGNVIIGHLKQDQSILGQKLDKAFVDIISADDFFEIKSLHHNKIIVFDDAVDEGHKIEDFLNKYQRILDMDDNEFSKFHKENIKIGAFVVNGKYYSELISKGRLNEELVGIRENDKKNFLNTILDIIAYLIHTGDIIDPDHLIIKGTLNKHITYSKMWDILKNTHDKLYEADFGYYHPDKKKVALYDLPYSDWVDVEHLNILDKKFQCKVRFVFDMVQCKQDLLVTDFMLAPVINPIIRIGLSQDCMKFEKQICKKFQMEPTKCCVDCVLFEVVTKVMSNFTKKWFKNLNETGVSIENVEVSWNHLNSTYKDYFQTDELKKLILDEV